MNMTLNSLAPTPAAPDAAPVTAPVPAGDAQPAATPTGAAAAPAAFAQWLGLGQRVDAAALPADTGVPAVADDSAPPTDAVEIADHSSAPVAQEGALLAAMSMPLMAPPPAPAFIRAASAVATDRPRAEGDASAAVALPLTAAELRTGLATASVPAAGVSATPSAMPSATPSATPSSRPRAAGAPADAPPAAAGAAPVAAPSVPVQAVPVQAVPVQAVPAQPVSAPALPSQSMLAQARVTAPVPAAAPTADVRPAAAPAADARPAADTAPAVDASAAPAADRPAGGWGVGAATTASARVPADSVALAGPPAAWRQTLHEALGERLNLQLSNRAEQAVIRLEPPMLGRVDIAIRHSAGTLEVTISATHGEVLRQLHAVSDNLRSDLAARQFTEVAVTVAPAPRGAQAGPHGEPQGRGRQPGREDQPQDPGRALADAGDSSSTFSLNGRA